jgi:tripartite ATP-independent transporter DctM subunit
MPVPLFIILVLLGLILLSMPISFALGITTLLTIIRLDILQFLPIIPQRLFGGVNSYVILAMPFFMLAGEVMNRTGITNSLIDFANDLVGWVTGGLANVNILASMLFAGLTGSAVSDTAALGSILIPSMVKSGYSKSYSASVTSASSVIGPIIPPSVIMVIYGALMNVSIAGLFAAGIIPGVLFGLSLIVVNIFISKKRDYPKRENPPSLKEVATSFKSSLPALFMPIIILGGILGGVFTPTEAAAVAVFYAIMVGIIFKSININDIWESSKGTALILGQVLIIIAAGSLLGWIISNQQVPQAAVNLLLTITENKILMLLLINLILLITGMFMDITAALIILAPILAPIAINLGMHPLHFGVIMTVNLTVGLTTPPLGACLFVAIGIADLELSDILGDIGPFVAVEVLVILLITFIPELVMYIPSLLGFA